MLNIPEAPPRGIALVAHPHSQQGGTLDNKVVQTLAKTFFALGYAVARFNFRGVGASGGTFDEGIGETDDALAVLAYAQESLGNALPVVLAGFSFGAYVQTRVAKRVGAQRLVLVGSGRSPFRRGVRSRRHHRHSRRRGRRGAAGRRVRVGAAAGIARSSCSPDADISFMAACRNCSA